MPHPMDTDTEAAEAASEPTVVDEPQRTDVRELPAERTTSPDVEDTGYQWDQTLPDNADEMPRQKPPLVLGTRGLAVSDSVLFGSALLGPDTPEFQLIPAHRDRVRVTIRIVQAAGEPDVYLGHGRNISESQTGWLAQDGDLLILETRGAVYCKTVGGADNVRIQWASELVAESSVV